MKPKTEDELIEQQRAESLAAFREKTVKIQDDIRKLEARKVNLQAEFDYEFAKKIEEIKALEEDLRSRISDADNQRHIISLTLKDAQVRLANADNLNILLSNKHDEHDRNVESHISATQEQMEAIRQRHAESMDREGKSNELLAEAQKRLADAIAKEYEVKEKASKLTHISENITNDIAIQSKLKSENEALLKEIESKKIELIDIQKNSESDKSEALTIRNSCDEFNVRMAKRKSELDEKDKDLKASSLRQEVVSQQQANREQAINSEIARLSQLRNDVDMLLKQKEAKEA